MLSQSASTNRKLSNVIAAGVVFTVISVVVSVLWVLFSYRQVLNMRTEYAMLRDSVADLSPTPANLPKTVNKAPAVSVKPQIADKAIVSAEKPKDTVAAIQKPVLKPLVKEPVTATMNSITKINKPNPKALNRKSIVLSYYYRRADNENLETTLQGLGYNFDIKEADKNTGYQKSNCVWFGADVPLAEVKRVAIAMIQSGNTVKGIRRFPQSIKKTAYKRNVIEVGMEVKLENYYTRPLSIVEIERAKSFK